jgi:hypothetical protein
MNCTYVNGAEKSTVQTPIHGRTCKYIHMRLTTRSSSGCNTGQKTLRPSSLAYNICAQEAVCCEQHTHVYVHANTHTHTDTDTDLPLVDICVCTLSISTYNTSPPHRGRYAPSRAGMCDEYACSSVHQSLRRTRRLARGARGTRGRRFSSRRSRWCRSRSGSGLLLLVWLRLGL